MTPFCWWLVDRVSRMLEPAERDVVRGDFAEAGETSGQALRDVVGLVARRQAVLWMDWRPWVALAALAAPLGVLLSLVSQRIAGSGAIYIWMYANNWDWKLTGITAFWVTLAQLGPGVLLSFVTLMSWSWSSGFALGSLSRRTIRVNGGLFCLALLLGELLPTPRYSVNDAVFSLPFYSVMFPLIVLMVLVLLPSLWGMHAGLRPDRPAWVSLTIWTAAVASFAELAMQSGVWGRLFHHPIRNVSQIRLLQFVAYWPLCCWVAVFLPRRRGSLKENRT